ncbi:MAG: hypothetical protein NTU74_17900, partial [Deltaproteobacteria bacterium]|nr:hypothetical protein [Deltaproteobacteria bacterium]
VVHMRYTAVDGGDKLKQPAGGSVQEYIKSVEDLSRQEGLFAAFDVKHDFSNEWYKAMQPQAGAAERLLKLNKLNERLPIFTKGRTPDKILATDVYLITSATLLATQLTLTQAVDEFTFTDGPQVGTMKSFACTDNAIPMNDWQLKINGVETQIEKLWLTIRYTIG